MINFFIYFCLNLYAQDSTNVIKKIVPCRYSFTVTWDRNQEVDMKGYHVYWGAEHRNYNYFTFVVDTVVQIFLNDSLKTDSVFVSVTAIDSANNESGFSKEIVFIPEVLNINLFYDENRRIDIQDLREFLNKYRAHVGKTSWKDY